MTAPRILVVEDERIIALHLRQQLMALGYDVPETVSSGEQALHQIEATRPNLVLMDIHLKGDMDGIATAAAIPSAQRVPVIYLTAYSGDATLQRAAATNPYGYLVKPFSERELHATIQMSLAKHRAEEVSRARLESRLRTRKMDALTQLAGCLAVEVKDLLTVLYGQLEVLGDHAIGEPALTAPIRDAFGEAIEKEHLINRLLEFSGRRHLIPATVSVERVIKDWTDQLRHIVGEAIEIRCNFPDDYWSARIDAAQLVRALSNLAENAREAMPNGGNLTIEGQNGIFDPDHADGHDPVTTGRYVLLSIADTGRGMTDHAIERAFEPFFTTKPAGGGAGLGLSLVFGFIRQSGGHISIDSRPGDGTTVRLYLPAALEDEFVRVEEIPGEAALSARGGPDADRPPLRQSATATFAAVAVRRQPHGDVAPRESAVGRHAQAQSSVSWYKAEEALYATVRIPPGLPRYRLIIEPLPRRDGWDWAVWRPGEVKTSSRHGRASSVISAMAAAEDAARHWVENESSDCQLA